MSSDLKSAEDTLVAIACDPATIPAAAGIVGAATYGIGGLVVGIGGSLAQSEGCPARPAARQGATPILVPAPPLAPARPRWLVPAAVGAAGLLVVGIIIYGATQ